MSTTTRRAACNCGQLQLTVEGEPVRVSMCHCQECQRRTGAVISNQARYRPEQVTITGEATEYRRSSDAGRAVVFRFCPKCGSTVWWTGEGFPGLISVAIGTFADPTFPPPDFSIWEDWRHPWVTPPAEREVRRAKGQG